MNLKPILSLILTVSLLALGVKWIVGIWGRVSLNAKDQPLGEVIQKIEGACHVEIATNVDSSTPVTLRLENATATDAIDRLASAIDARWRLCYVVAGQKSAITTAFARWEKNDPLADWKWIDHPMPGGGMLFETEPSDPRSEPWPGGLPSDKSLADYFDVAAQKIDVAFALPSDWNGVPPKRNITGPVRRAVPDAAKQSGGVASEFFLIRGRPPQLAESEGENAGPEPGRGERGGGFFGQRQRPDSSSGERRAPPDFAAVESRIAARIEKLPPEERAAAKAEMDRFRQFRESLRDLPEEQRREKMREMFQDPVFQSRMEERQAARDARRSPEQRRDRYQRYVERKASIKGESPQPPR